MKPTYWLIIVLALASFALKAQDQTNFSQFFLNPYLINSSYAAIDGQPSFTAFYKRQWTNIKGGPAIANISLQAPINDKFSFGLSITNDKRGLLNNSGLLASLAYHLPVGDFSHFRFGLSVGGSWNTLDLDAFESNLDPAFANILKQNASLTGNAGLSFHHKTFNIGISMPTLFSPSYVSQDAFTITEVAAFKSMIFNVSNRFYFNDDKNIFEPYLIYRMNGDLPGQIELAGIMHVNHVIWVGGSFRQDYGISALGGIKLQNMLALGASFSLKNTGINELNSPSFEISLSYLVGQRKKGAHAYSFVNTEKPRERKTKRAAPNNALAKKKQEEERQRNLAEVARKKEEARLRQEAYEKRMAEKAAQELALQKEQQKRDSVAARPVTHTSRFQVGMETKIEDNVQTSVEPEHPEGHPAHEEEKLERLEVHAADPDEHHDKEIEAHPHAERHEFIKRGGHHEELEVADYVVVGVFKSDANARHFTDGLTKLGFKADYGHLTEKALWYVYTIQTDDINAARAERDRVRKMKLMRDAWLLTVHH